MKKLLIPFLLCICRVAVSQGVEVGPLVGANFSWLTHKEGFFPAKQSSRIKSGIMAGAYVRIFVSKKFSIQPELMFASYGGKYKNENYKIKLNYIALPVFARLNITPAFFVFTGPQAGFMVGGKDKNNFFKSTYFSYLLGAGYLFKEPGLEISVRYNQGISVISEPFRLHDMVGNTYSINPNVRISSFQIVLAYRLFGGEKE